MGHEEQYNAPRRDRPGPEERLDRPNRSRRRAHQEHDRHLLMPEPRDDDGVVAWEQRDAELEAPDGGYTGFALESVVDCEYTFYGLGVESIVAGA